MRITEVRVKLNPPSQDRLRGFCTITLDDGFVVRDIKIIDGPNGIFVAMPSRKIMDHCPQCHGKNHARARFCDQCGHRLDENRYRPQDEARVKLHCDVAHPVDAATRAMIHEAILMAFNREVERSQRPGYTAQDVGPLSD